MLIHEYKSHEAEVSIVRFLAPFPLLLTSDASGLVNIWLTKPHPEAGRLVTTWRNTLDLKQCTPISAIDSHYNHETREFLLFLGDELGFVRVQDISILLDKVPNLEPITMDNKDKKRNPHRVFEIDFDAVGKNKSAQETYFEEDHQQNGPNYVDESQILQRGQWVAHTDVVKSIQFINITSQPLILTASSDQYVHIWPFVKEDPTLMTSDNKAGTLKQGCQMMPDYKWDFRLENQKQISDQRGSQTKTMLKDVRKMRDENMSTKRREEIQAI